MKPLRSALGHLAAIISLSPESEGNGVVPIKKEFVEELKLREWTVEGPAKNKLGANLGDFDAVIAGPEGFIVAEWETGNISSSHRSMNKLISSPCLSAMR